MAKEYLIDTSVVIKYLNQTFSPKAIAFIDAAVDFESNISFITEIELQAWNPPDEADISVYINFVKLSHVIGISDSIITTTIAIRKNYKLKLGDAIIAATALVNNYTLLADNDKDFLKAENLNYLNPRNIV